MLDQTCEIEALLTVRPHPITGAFFGSVKLDPQAAGLPTGGETLADAMERAFTLTAAYFGRAVEEVKLTVVTPGAEPFAVVGDGSQAADLGVLTSAPSRRTLSQTHRWGRRTNRTWVHLLLKIIERGADLVLHGGGTRAGPGFQVAWLQA